MPALPPIVDGAVSDDIPDLSVPLSDLASSRRSSMGSSIFNLDHVSIDYFQDYSDSQLSALSISDIPDRDLPLFTGSDQSLHQLPFDEHLISNPCDLPALENSTSFTKSRSSQSSGPISPISLADGVQPPTNASPTLVAPKAQQQKRLHSHILPNGKKDSRPRNHT
ncbi:hypothetical protein HDU82_007080 [Entophlyctis luteolus]|nr:hypothetical protein HDU82_007080 [Entophlyctis luteolus]